MKSESLFELQKRVKEFAEKHRLEEKPEFRLLDIVSELGEVAKELLEQTGYGKRLKSENSRIGEELGDLLFSLICLANAYSIDLEKALGRMLSKYEQRIAKKGSASSRSEINQFL